MSSWTANIFSNPKAYTFSTSPNSAFSSGKDIGIDSSPVEQKLIDSTTTVPQVAFEPPKTLGLTLNASNFSNSFNALQTGSIGGPLKNMVNLNSLALDIGVSLNNYCW